MRVYLSCHAKEPANELAKALAAAGHTVCSLWHHDPSERPAPDAAAEWGDRAAHNLTFIRTADVVVLIAGPDRYPGGKFYEAGFAHGYGKKVAVLGRVENGMLYHPGVKRFADEDALLAWLSGDVAGVM